MRQSIQCLQKIHPAHFLNINLLLKLITWKGYITGLKEEVAEKNQYGISQSCCRSFAYILCHHNLWYKVIQLSWTKGAIFLIKNGQMEKTLLLIGISEGIYFLKIENKTKQKAAMKKLLSTKIKVMKKCQK